MKIIRNEVTANKRKIELTSKNGFYTVYRHGDLISYITPYYEKAIKRYEALKNIA